MARVPRDHRRLSRRHLPAGPRRHPPGDCRLLPASVDLTAGPHADLLARRRGEIDAALRSHVAGRGPVALVNFPNHANAGDDAIWLGAEAALRRLRVKVGYRASWESYDPAVLALAVPAGPILLNGGGNLGDVYARQQGVRDRVLEDFVGRPVVQLPQSIWFRDLSWPAAFAARAAAHGDLVLLVRDRPSLEHGKRLGARTVELCPDLALGLTPRPRPVPPTVDIVWCPQHQAESCFDPPQADDVEVLDWLGGFPDELAPARAVGVAGRIERLAVGRPQLARRAPGLVGWAFTTLGEHYVNRAMRALSRGQVVVTERLHGHIFCLLLGIPHVLLDSVNGKVTALHEAWSADSPLVHRASAADEALHRARSMVTAS